MRRLGGRRRFGGWRLNKQKRERLHNAGVHLIEIDLLRRGQHAIEHVDLPKAHYIISLIRKESWQTTIWAVDIKDTLPIIPVPLKEADKDTVLDLPKAFKDVYEQSHYHLAINYQETPVRPPFSKANQEWMKLAISDYVNNG